MSLDLVNKVDNNGRLRGTAGSAHCAEQALFSGEGPNMPLNVEHRYAYYNLVASAATTVKAAPGFLDHVLLPKMPAGTGFVLYDSATATGTIIDVIGEDSPNERNYQVEFYTGLTIVPISYVATIVPTVFSSTATHFTVTFGAAHGFKMGQTILIAGCTPVAYNGTFQIFDVPSTTTLRVASTANPGAGTGFGTVQPFGSLMIAYR
jgi:hypothetical protein